MEKADCRTLRNDRQEYRTFQNNRHDKRAAESHTHVQQVCVCVRECMCVRACARVRVHVRAVFVYYSRLITFITRKSTCKEKHSASWYLLLPCPGKEQRQREKGREQKRSVKEKCALPRGKVSMYLKYYRPTENQRDQYLAFFLRQRYHAKLPREIERKCGGPDCTWVKVLEPLVSFLELALSPILSHNITEKTRWQFMTNWISRYRPFARINLSRYRLATLPTITHECSHRVWFRNSWELLLLQWLCMVRVTGTPKHVKSSVVRSGGIVLRWSSGSVGQEANSWDPGSIPGRDTSFDVPESSCLLSGPGLQLDSRYSTRISKYPFPALDPNSIVNIQVSWSNSVMNILVWCTNDDFS